MSFEILKCPHCGYVYRIDAEKIFEDGQTTVVRKLGQRSLFKPRQEEYIDLTCPNCDEEFEWQIR